MTNAFHMTPEEFRRRGREVVDSVADYMSVRRPIRDMRT
jgi:hypothetical protein